MKKMSFVVVLGLFFVLSARENAFSEPKKACDSFGIQRYQEKKQAPLFSLENLDGNQVALSDFKGKPVLIVFWATW